LGKKFKASSPKNVVSLPYALLQQFILYSVLWQKQKMYNTRKDQDVVINNANNYLLDLVASRCFLCLCLVRLSPGSGPFVAASCCWLLAGSPSDLPVIPCFSSHHSRSQLAIFNQLLNLSIS